MGKLNKISNVGLGLIFGPLLVIIIQLGGFMPSNAFLYYVGPITMIIGFIILILGFSIMSSKNNDVNDKYNEVPAGGFHSAGLELFQRGDLDKALTYINRAIAKNPHHSDLFFDKAVILVFQGKWKEALIYIDLALKIEPNFQSAIKVRELITQLVEKLDKRSVSNGDLNSLETETMRKIKDLFQKFKF
ncbi:hypothetical protein LCGC14_0982310 [marine sediment metagenome]|uniref:Uncharacterized protein n=1 Tax=marine sediment metagenome TaxID=412755 RepID=A0A0F9NCW1_9ZZZZ|nr:tetratricopeptide repeat protein [bacterium]